MTKKENIKKKQDEINELDLILDEIQPEVPSIPNEIVESTNSRNAAAGYMDSRKIRRRARRTADKLISGLVKFYLHPIVLEDPYIKLRIEDDKNTISELLYNMRAADHSIAKLVEVIDEGGAIVPRNFEVLAKLQSTKMEIVKHYESVKRIIEENYKIIKVDYENNIKLLDEDEEQEVEAGGFGHRNLLKNLAENMEINTDYVSHEDVISRNMVTPDVPDMIPNTVIPYDDDEDEEENIALPKGVKMYDRRESDE